MELEAEEDEEDYDGGDADVGDGAVVVSGVLGGAVTSSPSCDPWMSQGCGWEPCLRGAVGNGDSAFVWL